MISQRILVAEDEHYLRHSLMLILKRSGYRVHEAESGTRALEMILDLSSVDESYDLLITDIQMNGLTGSELIAELNRRCIFLPIIVITGYESIDAYDAILQKDCIEFVKKPFRIEDILDSVSRSLSPRPSIAGMV